MKRCPNCHQEYSDAVTMCPHDGQILMLNPDPMIGKLLEGKYKLENCIGVGGMATVYLATRAQIGDNVAVKVLNEESLRNPLAVARFRREAQAAARIRHSGVVTIHDMGNLPEGNTFLVMEYIRGHSLRDELKEHKTLSVPRAVSLLSAVCSAVHAAHEAGIIHRDLKPENIMVETFSDSSESIKVVDFGVAELREHIISDAMTKLTEAGMMVGTPYYISPEQCRGEPLDPRADVYSLGIILYELLTGHVPFRGRTLSAVIIQHATEPPPPIRKIRPDVTESVETVILRALAKERSQRPATARDMGQELERALAGITLTESIDIIIEPIKTSEISKASETSEIQVYESAPSKIPTPSRNINAMPPRKSGLLNYDSLTGLHSHAYFMRNLEENILRCSQLNESLGVVLFGIDGLKRINNTYGYLLGDLLLREVGHLLSQRLPEQMSLCRAPGDGFTTMAATKNPELVVDLASKLIETIRGTRFLTKELPEGLEITISAGISFYPEDSLDAIDLFEIAKQSLATAKSIGLGEVARKGSSGPLSHLVSHTEPQVQFESFVGRKLELEKLQRNFEQSVAGRGRFILITGDAGLGKTRLVEEFRRQLAGKDTLFLQGRFYESGGSIPYKAFCDSLRGSLHYLMEYNQEDTQAVFGSMTGKVIADFSSNDPLSLLLSNELSSNNAEQEKYRIFDYLVRIYLNLSKLRPVVLFLDDLQWADELTLDFLAYLIRNTTGERLFFLATSREWELTNESNPVRAWLRQMSRYGNQEQIKLSPLTETEVANVLESMFGHIDIPQAMLARFCQETKGNPFYLNEIVRLLIEEKAIEWNGEHWSCKDVGEIRLPNSIVDLVEAHLVKLASKDLDVFTQAAVLGNEFTFETLEAITELDEDELLEILETGLREHILREQPSSNSREDRYSFYHSTIRKVLYERTSRRRRKRLHQQIGRKLEEMHADRANKIASELVYHYYNAEDYEHALSYAVEAGNLAWRALAFSEAAKYYEWAEKSIQNLTSSLKDEPLARTTGGNQVFQLAICGLQIESDRMAQYHLNYGQLFMQLGNHQRAESQLRQTLDLARQVRSLKLVGRAFTALGELYRQYGQLSRGLEYGEQGLAVLTSIEDSEWEVQSLMVIGASHEGLGHFSQALEQYEGALVLARKIKDRFQESSALCGMGVIYYRLGQYEKAQDAAKRALEISTLTGDRLAQERCQNLMGVILLEIGQFHDALRNFEKALKIARDMGYRLRETSILNNIGEHYRRQMRYQEAYEYYQQALSITKETSDRPTEASILLNIGLLYQGQGNHETALSEFIKAQRIIQELGLRPTELESLVSIGDSLAAVNNVKDAQSYFQYGLDLSRQSGSPVFEWRALYGLARCEMAKGNKKAALKLLTKTVEVIDLMSSELTTYANRLSFLKNKQIVYNDLAELTQDLNKDGVI